MSELIKREDAIKITWQEPQYYDPINALTEVREKIRALPTVDAVPVVRCGECKYFIENTWECVLLSDRFGDEYSDARVYPEYYCADGERKDGERRTDE